MTLVDEFVERISAQCGDKFRIIETVGDLARLKDVPPAVPAAYVYIKEEAAAENTRINDVMQRTEVDVCVLIITRNLSDARGGAAATDIEVLKNAVRPACVGWQPASAIDAVENVGGQLISAIGGTVRWEHTFSAAFYSRGQS